MPVPPPLTQDPREAMLDRLCDDAFDHAVTARRHLHRNPELGWKEHETQSWLANRLAEIGLKPVSVAGTGLYVDIGTGTRPVIYRADIDALPIPDGKNEATSTCISGRAGISHACGHDAHAAVALGLAEIFAGMGSDLPGPVRVVFQPAEEVIPSGGEAVVAEGVADGARAALALHCDPTRDAGVVGVRSGPLTSSSDRFEIEVIGRSGHGSRPYLAHDPILAAADVVRSLYGLIGQRVDPLETAVLSVGMIHGGQAENVIPGAVRLVGTVRTLQPDVRALLHEEIRRSAEAVGALHHCGINLRIDKGSPPVVNDPSLHAVVSAACQDVLGGSGVQEIDRPSTGAEDFSQFGLKVPTYMMRLGVCRPGGRSHHLHTPTFDVDERAIRVALWVMGRAILRLL